MPRDFQINGETLVRVRFGGHLAGGVGGGLIDGALFPGTEPLPGGSGQLYELGLAEENVNIVPQYIHRGVPADDFGPEVPAEVIAMLAWVSIQMTLIHYDVNVLEECLAEALGGNAAIIPPPGKTGIAMMGAGQALGHGLPIGSSGCHYVSLNLLSPQLQYPWRFYSCYLAGQPVTYPLGTEKSAVVCNFRAIPYTYPGQGFATALNTSGQGIDKEVASSGRVLWDRVLDTP